MNLWLQRSLLLAAGLAVGAFLHPLQPANRFVWDKNRSYVLDTKTGQVFWDKDGSFMLDTKTGQICTTVAGKKYGTNLPVCLDTPKRRLSPLPPCRGCTSSVDVIQGNHTETIQLKQ